MQIRCPKCDTPIPAQGINIHDQLAVCPQCSAVFSFADHFTRKAKTRKVKQPEILTVTEENNALDMQFRWIRMMGTLDYVTVAIFAVSFIIPGIAAVVLLGTASNLFQALLGSLFFVPALAFFYMFLMTVMDRLHIRLDDDALSAKYEPLPIWRNTRIGRGEVERVYCFAPPQLGGKTSRGYYNVQVVYRDGSEITLATLRREMAMYVSQMLEAYLHEDGEPVLHDEEPGEESLPLEEALLPEKQSSGARR